VTQSYEPAVLKVHKYELLQQESVAAGLMV
jgi:hypothetical protein